MKMKEEGSLITNMQLSEYETDLHITLPPDYKEFILKHNGGRPSESWAFRFFEVGENESTSSVISYFMSFSDQYDSIQNCYMNLVELGEVPVGLLPIADDPGGNSIFISCATADFGKVCFGDHELEDPETGYLVMSPVADSFTDFLNQIYIDE
jgi:cell wall assembly regulator SMI1